MKGLKYSEILARNRELGNSMAGSVYRIALLSNVVMNQLAEVMEFSLRTQGINAEVTIGEYDNIVQDSERFKDADAVVMFWEAANLVEGFHASADTMNSAELTALAERVEGEISLVLQNLKHVPLVLFNRFSSLVFSANELRSGSLDRLCNHLNHYLDQLVTTTQITVDIDKVLAKVGLETTTDFRQFQSSKALYTIDFLKRYAEAVLPAFRAATGRSKKVLVLDCDNTLWFGILGEDGEGGIQIGGMTIKGKIFAEVQQILRGFRHEGALLALCSKNNPEDVDRVFASHPDTILGNEDFVARKVNWQDKATNLRELAAELNLGLDSFVFVDDSSFELGLVEKELPMVKCIQVPKNLSEYPSQIRGIKQEFFMLSRTTEDAQKTKLYHQEQQRKEQAVKFDSIDDYLTSLKLNLTILWDEEVPVSRTAQLTQKTNQFNLTTKRYTEADIQRMQLDANYSLAVFSLADSYGDYGATGMAIIRLEKDSPGTAVIDSFLMSCRVIGRKVEYAFFDELVRKCQRMGIVELRAEYVATQKNSQVASFYDDLKFEPISIDVKNKKYLIRLAEYEHQNIKYISIN